MASSLTREAPARAELSADAVRPPAVNPPGSTLKVCGVAKSFAAPGKRGRSAEKAEKVPALLPVDLVARPGEFVSIVGPSGCGKSTLFSIIAGLETPTEGFVEIDGRDRTGQTGLVGYMLQKDMLMPWRTVLGNVIIGLEVRGFSRRQAMAAARPLLEHYGLGGYGKAKPAQLSGGMRGRAALLRTLLFNRQIMLLDEPFGALDAQTRLQMQLWLLDVHASFHKTTILVTHDVEEAVLCSDRIYVMSGRPGFVADEVTVDLPRPRKVDCLADPAFISAKERVRATLMATPEAAS
ncbi:MAG: ABC transporter ATP-binding protein [Bifidobacteriaceae bacterium]|jgi:ABC-type nitrate/sulfonate/bicarbonate transport system ATPase subunit|nr:ABC transporter ATP-binding protein [Bifidobacteriaceae bacterium]